MQGWSVAESFRLHGEPLTWIQFVLSDDDSLLSVLSRWPLFRESDDADVTPDIVVFPTADVNDQLKVQVRTGLRSHLETEIGLTIGTNRNAS